MSDPDEGHWYTIAVMPWGFTRDVWALSEKEALAFVWQSLSAAQQDYCECLDCLEER